MTDEIKLVEIVLAVVAALCGGAMGYGMLRQQVNSLRRDLDKLDRHVEKMDEDQGEKNKELFTLLHGMNRNLHRLMGKLDVEPRD